MKNAETELLQLDFSVHFHTKKNEMLGDLNYYIYDLRSATLLWRLVRNLLHKKKKGIMYVNVHLYKYKYVVSHQNAHQHIRKKIYCVRIGNKENKKIREIGNKEN